MNKSEMVLVPRALLGAVASALETGNSATKTLESVREFYLGDVSEEQPGADDFPDVKTLQESGKCTASADWALADDGIDLEAADFSDALMWLKEGKSVQRAGWNGEDQFVYRVKGDKLASALSYGFGEYLGEPTFRDMFVLRNSQNELCSWVPSMGDLMATDWQVVA